MVELRRYRGKLVDTSRWNIGKSRNASVIKFFYNCSLQDTWNVFTRVVELVDTQDLKSCLQQCKCGFNSHPGYKASAHLLRLFHYMYFVYILYSKNYDRYYVGHCENLITRLIRHNNKGVPSTKPYVPWEMVYTENFVSRSSASAREKEIKNKKSRKYIEFLIRQE